MSTVSNILEVDKVLDSIANYSINQYIKDKIKGLKFTSNSSKIEESKSKSINVINYLKSNRSIEIQDIENIEVIISYLEKSRILSITDSFNILELLRVVNLITREFEDKNISDNPYLKDVLNNLDYNIDIYKYLTKIIKSSDEIHDNASVNLKEIRNNIENKKKSIERLLREYINNNKQYLTDTSLYYKDNKYSVAVSLSNKYKISGEIVDYSNSRNTVFIAPKIAIRIESELKQLHEDENEEIERILKDLTIYLLNHSETLKKLNDTIFELFFHFAIGAYAINEDAYFASWSKKFVVEEYAMPLIDKNKVVRNTFEIDSEKILVISGPNAGGKTVALKSVALISYLNQLALPLTSRYPGTLPYYNRIYLDIGDEQSLEQSLSTFSSHLVRLINIIDHARDNDLVIIDELGAGTDPLEGEALGVAIIKELEKKNTTAIISTHYQLIKEYAKSSDKSKVLAMRFDKEALAPSYKIIPGMIESSFAFYIASTIGLKKSIIDEALAINKERESLSNKLLEKLQSDIKALKVREEEIEKLESTLKEKISETTSRNDELQLEIQRVKDRSKEAVNEVVKQYEERFELLLKESKENSKNIKKNIEQIVGIEDELDDDVNNEQIEFKVNDTVRIKSSNIEGYIEKIDGKQFYIKAGNFLIKSVSSDLLKISKVSTKRINYTDKKIFFDFNKEINILGKTVVEGITLVERHISNAIKANAKTINIIHGLGTGALMVGIHKYLRNNKLVSSFHLAESFQGGDGVTIVYLK